MSKYFKNSSYTENSLKKEYRKLAQIYHPDKGGKASVFKEMEEEYEVILKQLKNNTYTAEPIKAEKTYQKTPQQTKTTKTPPKKKKQEPIHNIEPDFVFLRSMFKKVYTFSIKHPLLCSNIIHTTLAIILWMLGIILFLGGWYVLAWILLVYSITALIIFKHYLFTFLLALLFTQFWHTQNPEHFIVIIIIAFICSLPFILVRADDATPNFYH
jgi:hypothetical protein